MRRRSLRLLRPKNILNSDGDTGEFFRVKNYRREFFCSKTCGLELAGIALRVNFTKGRRQVKRTADFYPKFTIALFTFIISFNIELSSTLA